MTILAALGFVVALAGSGEPVTFEFLRGCGPADAREQPYDPQTQQYHIAVRDIARFRVRSVAGDLASRPVVLRITGMLDHPEGPLTLCVDGRRYVLHHERFDDTLFRIQRREGVTTIEFLPEAKALLKTGATCEYIDYYRG
jgi:hypothetical protein